MARRTELAQGGPVYMFGYFLYRDVGQRSDEDLRALVESELLKGAIRLDYGNILIAFEAPDDKRIEILLSLLRDAIGMEPQFFLISSSQGSRLFERWSIPDVFLCVTLLTSTELDASEILRRIVANNQTAQVDMVEVIPNARLEQEQEQAVLAQFAGARRSDVVRQLANALTVTNATTAFRSFSPGPEEEERSRRWRSRNDPLQDAEFEQDQANDVAIRRIAGRRKINADEAIRAAAQTLDWIDTQIDDGGHFIVVRERKKQRVSFPR